MVHITGIKFYDFVNLFHYLLQHALLFSSFYIFLIAALGATAISIYGFFEGRNIRVTTVNIETNKLPSQVPSLRIVQLSDAHIGLMMTKKHLQKMIDLIAQTKPDLVLSTGDLIDSHPAQFNDFARMLQQIKPRYGKYAVTGNHEFYLGLPLATKFHELAGFKLLRQEAAVVANAITLVGVDDPTAVRLGVEARISEADLLYHAAQNKFTILLKHQPRVRAESARWFDLQLSGHVHHGQIFPFDLIVHYLFKYDGGHLYNLGSSSLYVSSGAGMWGPPIRFLAPPEITVINIYSGK